MRNLPGNKFKIRYLAGVIPALWISACSGGGSCSSCNNLGSESVTFTISAPNEYPAGIPVTAVLTMKNTSNVTANDLHYFVPPPGGPSSGNTTGVPIDVTNAAIACPTIAPGASCQFTAYIESGSIPGSFTVFAQGNSNANFLNNTVNYVKSAVHINTPDFNSSVTANIGLADCPNSNDALCILPISQTIIPNTNATTNVYFSLLVESSAGASNINIYNGGQTPIKTLTGPFAFESVVTFYITLPVGESIPQTITAIPESCSESCSNQAMVNIAESGTGILTLSPSSLIMTGYNESQIYTITNTGQGGISNIKFPLLPPNFYISESSDCNTTLTTNYPGNSCTFQLNYNPLVTGESGVESFNISYYNSKQYESTPVTITYASQLNLTLTNSLLYDCTKGNLGGKGIQAQVSGVVGIDGQDITVFGRIINLTEHEMVTESCTMTISGGFGTCRLLSNAPVFVPGPGGCMGQDQISLVTTATSPSYQYQKFPYFGPESATYRGYLILESWPTNGNNRGAGYFSIESGNIVAPVGESVVATMIGSYGYAGKQVKIMLPTWVWSTFYPYNNPTSLNTNTESCTITYVENESPTCTWNSPIVFTLSNGNAVHTHSNYTSECAYVNSASYKAWAFPSNGNGSFTQPFTASNASQNRGTYSYTSTTGC